MLRCLFSASVVMLHSYASHNLFLSLRNVIITDDVKMLCFLLLLFHILAFYFNIEQGQGDSAFLQAVSSLSEIRHL